MVSIYVLLLTSYCPRLGAVLQRLHGCRTLSWCLHVHVTKQSREVVDDLGTDRVRSRYLQTQEMNTKTVMTANAINHCRHNDDYKRNNVYKNNDFYKHNNNLGYINHKHNDCDKHESLQTQTHQVNGYIDFTRPRVPITSVALLLLKLEKENKKKRKFVLTCHPTPTQPTTYLGAVVRSALLR